MGSLARLFILLLVAALVAATALGGWYHRALNERGPLTIDTPFVVEPGTGLMKLSYQLKRAGALDQDRVFRLAGRLEGAAPRLKAGEFLMPAEASARDLLTLFQEGEPIQRFVTFAEGLTSAQIVRQLNAAPGLEGEITSIPPEGVLLPETYSYTWGESRRAILRRMEMAQTDLLDSLWPTRADDLPVTSPAEAVILASIVEKETALAAERPLVASVFLNRLRKGMRLESDPTIIYGLTGGEPLGRPIRRSEIRSETAYNTYVIKGLPPAPIANPGAAAIQAVLNPEPSDFLFFVADGEGGHAFAQTLAEHNRNVARWRALADR